MPDPLRGGRRRVEACCVARTSSWPRLALPFLAGQSSLLVDCRHWYSQNDTGHSSREIPSSFDPAHRCTNPRAEDRVSAPSEAERNTCPFAWTEDRKSVV